MADISLIPQYMVKNLESDLNDKVSKTDNEIIAGEKTFENRQIIVQNPNFAVGDTITSDPVRTKYFMADKNGKSLATFENVRDTVGNVYTLINTTNKDGTKWLVQPLHIGYNSAGQEFCKFPTPADPNEKSDYGATTKWVQNLVNTSTKNDGYVIINGLLVQWGIADNGGDGTDWSKLITFKKPYSNNNYVCLANDFRVSNALGNRDSYTSIVAKTSTSMIVAHFKYNYRFIAWMTIGV